MREPSEHPDRSGAPRNSEVSANVRRLIAHYALEPLPLEGTLFTATYRSTLETSPGQPAGTAMIGLYSHEPLSRSLFHRLLHDEVWHHYGGDPIRLVLLHPDGTTEERWLGSPTSNYTPQTVISAGTWQAGELHTDGSWALFGCTVAPGFTPSCFEAGTAEALLQTHPQCANDILRLTPASEPLADEVSSDSAPPAAPAMPSLSPARTPHEARERAALLGQLGAQRRHIVSTAQALTSHQRAQRPLPSGWNTTALLQHLTYDVERWWFRRVLLGEDVDVGGPNGNAWIADDAPSVDALDGYIAETEAIDAMIAKLDLDTPLAWWPSEIMGEQFMHHLRDLVLHVTTETACHAGHLDVVRELLTGEQWLVLE